MKHAIALFFAFASLFTCLVIIFGPTAGFAAAIVLLIMVAILHL